MNLEKRRKARIQGGWNSQSLCETTEKSDNFKPLWMTSNIDGSKTEHEKFLYEEIEESPKPEDTLRLIQ